MDTQSPTARITARTPLHEGFLRVYQYRIEMQQHGGGTRQFDWELMERGNSVGVLVYDPVRNEVLLGNECRPGALVSGDHPFRDQLIAGGMQPDESPLDAADRELREEAGVTLRDAAVIHPGAYVSSGGTSERVALVFGLADLAGVAGRIHGNDAKEDVLAVVLPAQTFIDRVLDGRIDDCKTLLAGYWFMRYLQGGLPQA